jgi:hypothetical protein
LRSERIARWTAVSAEEQAVSTMKLGPRKSSMYEMRFAAMLDAPPVIEWESIRCRLKGYICIEL